MRRGGFTLIELLAAVAIIATAAGIAATGLAGASRQARVRQCVAELRDLDARARLVAQREGAITVAIDEDGRRVTAGPLEVRIPHGLTVEIAPPAPAESVTIDRRGCGPDYRVRVGSSDTDTVIEWTVLGLSGAVIALESGP